MTVVEDPTLEETGIGGSEQICHIPSNWLKTIIAQAKGEVPPPPNYIAVCGFDCTGRVSHSREQCDAAGHGRCIVCIEITNRDLEKLGVPWRFT